MTTKEQISTEFKAKIKNLEKNDGASCSFTVEGLNDLRNLMRDSIADKEKFLLVTQRFPQAVTQVINRRVTKNIKKNNNLLCYTIQTNQYKAEFALTIIREEIHYYRTEYSGMTIHKL